MKENTYIIFRWLLKNNNNNEQYFYLIIGIIVSTLVQQNLLVFLNEIGIINTMKEQSTLLY